MASLDVFHILLDQDQTDNISNLPEVQIERQKLLASIFTKCLDRYMALCCVDPRDTKMSKKYF